MSTAKLILEGREFELPVVAGTEDETGIDITSLRAKSMAITLDPGYGNTGACRSAITFIIYVGEAERAFVPLSQR